MSQVMNGFEIIKLNEWKNYCTEDAQLLEELDRLQMPENRELLQNCFGEELTFGTGGLRGVSGAGTNRMNPLTVARATLGLARCLKSGNGLKIQAGQKRCPEEVGEAGAFRVAVSYDSRLRSDLFAHTAAEVLAAEGVEVYLYDRLMPTPMLSFAVRYLHCDAGIMVTASHNPAEYNGYKAYNSYGCQLNLEEADRVMDFMAQTSIEETAQLLKQRKKLIDDRWGLKECIHYIPEAVIDKYMELVRAESTGTDCSTLSVVYTPLNGTGNEPVRRILKDIGVGCLRVVPEQELPDGHFPTCPYPNPEKRQALELGLQLCQRLSQQDAVQAPDLLLATDPDCDRIGIAVYSPRQGQKGCSDSEENYHLLTGNQVGVLLLDYLFCVKKLPRHPLVLKTIVTTEMAAAVAKAHGAELCNVLTGFKFIGEQMDLLEDQGELNRYVFGFEESYGYLVGSFVRDKDAVSAAMLICEMAAYYKRQGKNLLQRMQELYRQYGYYEDYLLDFSFDGITAMKIMDILMGSLRKTPQLLESFLDTGGWSLTDYENDETGLPKSDVLVFRFQDDSQVVVRPSGTEPKLKLYLSVKGVSLADGEARMDKLKKQMSAMTIQLAEEAKRSVT